MSRASATSPVFEVAGAKGKGAPIAHAFLSQLKTKTVGQIIEQDLTAITTENPGKLGTSVLEVILIRCTQGICPRERASKSCGV